MKLSVKPSNVKISKNKKFGMIICEMFEIMGNELHVSILKSDKIHFECSSIDSGLSITFD